MQLAYLSDHPEYVSVVSQWVYEEFVVKENGTSPLEKSLEKFSHTYPDVFPVTLIALEGEVCAGTVTLYDNDLETQHELTPWLGSLYVPPEHRGRGIAKELIRQALSKTRSMGYPVLYLRTEHAAEYYRALGWVFVQKTKDERERKTEVFQFQLTS